MAKRKEKPNTAEGWMESLTGHGDRPDLLPAIGVRIECRIVVDREYGWEEVKEILEKCREYGSAEVTEYLPFAKTR